MKPPYHKVSKGKLSKKEKSTKRIPSSWENVDSFMDSAPSVSQVTKTSKTTRKKTHCTDDIVYWSEIPLIFQRYVEHVVDVKADGNCGYRVIAAQVYNSQEKWM